MRHQVAEQVRERLLLPIVELLLVAEENHTIRQQRLADLCDLMAGQ
jgi:hypothetical protein